MYHQDVATIVDADVIPDVVLYSAEITTAVYGLLFFSSSVEDVVEIHGETTDVVLMTVVCGSSFFSSSVEDVVETHGITTDVAVTTVAAVN